MKIVKVNTFMGFPSIVYIDESDRRKKIEEGLYRKSNSGFWFDRGGLPIKETRPEILEELNKLEWAKGRDCLASAPWLM